MLGTDTDAIDRSEDRERFNALVNKLALRQPRSGLARTAEDAVRIGQDIGYPVIVRPSYVIGGRVWRWSTRPKLWSDTSRRR